MLYLNTLKDNFKTPNFLNTYKTLQGKKILQKHHPNLILETKV